MANILMDAIPDPRSYRFILKDFSDKLSKRDLGMIKFICADHVPASELEKLDNGFSVWKSLEDKGYLGQNDYTLLEEILYLAGRIDLVRTLSSNAEKVVNRIKRGDTLLSPFRILLCKLGSEISQKNLEAVKYIFTEELSRCASEEATDIWKFFLLLEKQDLIAPGHVANLGNIIETLAMPRLQKLVDEYKESDPGKNANIDSELGHIYSPEMNWQRLDLGVTEVQVSDDELKFQPLSHPVQTSDTSVQPSGSADGRCQQMPHSCTDDREFRHFYMPPNSNYGPSSSVQKYPQHHIRPILPHTWNFDEIEPLGRLQSDVVNLNIGTTCPEKNDRELGRHLDTKGPICPPSEDEHAAGERRDVREVKQMRNFSKELSMPELPAYKMTACPRGPCIIINNQLFTHNSGDKKCRKLENRPGSRVDEESLTLTFRKLGFEVLVYTDCPVDKMKRILAKYANDEERMKKSDAFVVVILSHGKFGAVYGADGYELKIVKILQYFRPDKCPALLNKPKLFFVQACQGKDKQKAFNKIHADDVTEVDDDLMPHDADFFIGYATIPGYVSYRHEDDGSWYISTLVEHLNKYAKKCDLLSIMTEVNRCVAKRSVVDDDVKYKQLPLPYTTLTKKVYFL